LLFSFILPAQPRPTLFPYTTLFRSKTTGESSFQYSQCILTPAVSFPENLVIRLASSRPLELSNQASIPWSPISQPADVKRGILLDRKSTRLNSSHVAIPYAVFCLKK